MATVKSLTRKASKSRAAWIVGIVAAAGAVGTGIYFAEKKSGAAAAPPPAPPPAVGPQPANTTPVFTQLTPTASVINGVNTYAVTIPAGSTFAFADSASDPNLTSIINGLNTASSSGTVTGGQSYAQGQLPPSWWPTSDPFGTAGYRLSGNATSTFSLVLGPLSSNSPAITPMVWVVTGWAAAPPGTPSV